MEYFFRWESKYGPEEPLGFRIVKDSSGRHYLLEVKSIPNFKEVNNKLEEEFPLLLMSLKGLDSIADSTVRRYGKHNMAMYAKRRKEAPKRYRVETRTFRIGDRFAEALYNKFVNWIDRFDSKAEGPSVGYWATFRCVVDQRSLDAVLRRRIHGRRRRAVRPLPGDYRGCRRGPPGRGEVSGTVGRLTIFLPK